MTARSPDTQKMLELRAAVRAPERSASHELLVLEPDQEMRRLLRIGLKDHFRLDVVCPVLEAWHDELDRAKSVLLDFDRPHPDDPDPQLLAQQVMAERPDVPLVGVTRERTIEAIQRVTEIGGRGVVSAFHDPAELREAIDDVWRLADRNRQDLDAPDRPRLGEIWSVLEPTAEVRNLELLLGTAELLSKSGLEVLVVEAGTQRGDIARLTGIGPNHPGLMELCAEAADLPARSTIRFLGRGSSGYRVLPYRNSLVTHEVPEKTMISTLLALADQVDVLLVDLPPADEVLAEEFLHVSHRIFLVTSPEDTALLGFRALRKFLSHSRQLRPRLVPVYSGWRGDVESRDRFLDEVYALPVQTAQILPQGPPEKFTHALRQLLPALIPPALTRAPLALAGLSLAA